MNKVSKFAKELFESWDVDGDGTMTEKELLKPLVSLSLAPDLKVAKQICQALDTCKGATMELSSKDFQRILKPNHVTDRLIEILSERSASRQAQIEYVMRRQNKPYERPDPYNYFEQLESKTQIWEEIVIDEPRLFEGEKINQVPVSKVASWFTKTGVDADADKAKETIQRLLKRDLQSAADTGLISKSEFFSFFFVGMFKCALNRLAQSLEREVKKGNIPASLTMATKLDILSRTGLVDGILNSQSENHK